MRPLKQLRAGFILATVLIYSTLLTSCNIVSKDDTLFESINGQSLFNEEIPALITFPDWISASNNPHFSRPGSMDRNILI